MYQPLNPERREIRLLLILPDRAETQIRIRLEVFTLNLADEDTTFEDESLHDQRASEPTSLPAPRYEALSYEWGDISSPRRSILVNEEPFEVRENLFQALLCLRATKVTARLWIDAISIDQDFVHERNHQVRMMDRIYASADRVRVWLGPDMFGISHAFDFISELSTAFTGRFANSWQSWNLVRFPRHLRRFSNRYGFEQAAVDRYLRMPGYVVPNIQKELYLDNDKWARQAINYLKSMDKRSAWWIGLTKLVELSYWSRVWIVQECFLARRIILCCGTETIGGEEVEIAFNILRLLSNEPQGDLTPFLEDCIDRIDRSAGKKIIGMRVRKEDRSLAHILEATKGAKCQDPRDRIYAILGLSDDAAKFTKSITVDYERDIFKVKMDVAWAVRQCTGFDNAYVSRICRLLDEIFPEFADPE